MGNLRNKMPITFWTFLFGALALAACPPFSGFYSKDSILDQAMAQHNYLLYIVGLFVAALTAFYIFRLFFVVFFSKEKSDHAEHAHESGPIITLPLVILAVFALIGGFIGIPGIYHYNFPVEGEKPAGLLATFIEPFITAPLTAGLGVLVFLAGIFLAYSLYRNADTDPLPAKLGGLATLMKNKFYFDEIYQATFVRAHDFIAAVADWIDRWLVEWLCIGFVRGGTDLTGKTLRYLQSGNLQTYAFLFVLGVAVALYFVLR